MCRWPGEPNGRSAENCLFATTKGWRDYPCSNEYRSICSVPTVTTLNSSTQVVFTSENISTTPAIQVRWVARPLSEDEYRNWEVSSSAQNKSQNILTSAKQIPGFKISWELRGCNKKISNISKSESFWRHSSKKNNINLFTIASLVRESRIKGIRESEVWETLLKHRWDVDFRKTNTLCLDENQTFEVIYKTALNLKINYGNHWIREEDLRLGTELYSVLSCPAELVEAAKLSKFFEFLITKENLNTVVAATMHNIQPRADDNIKDFIAISTCPPI